jgi:hypothetical protein
MFRTAIRQTFFVAALMLFTASVALAAPGGAGKTTSSSSISLVTTAAGTTTGATAPSYDSSVTFNVSTDATSQPFVHLRCSQNGTLVLESWQAWFYGAVGAQMFTLGPTPAWQGGAADCTAYLENWDSYSKNGKVTVLASTAFHVNA